MQTGDKEVPEVKLTVLIRNDGPLIFCGDSPKYRSVAIALTDEQLRALSLDCVGIDCGRAVVESISTCFLEAKS